MWHQKRSPQSVCGRGELGVRGEGDGDERGRERGRKGTYGGDGGADEEEDEEAEKDEELTGEVGDAVIIVAPVYDVDARKAISHALEYMPKTVRCNAHMKEDQSRARMEVTASSTMMGS